MTKGEKAESLFKEGYNCSQSVAMAFADELNIPSDVVAMSVSGFGGGMGRMREVCGCVSGMVYVLSILYGIATQRTFRLRKNCTKESMKLPTNTKKLTVLLFVRNF